MLHVFVSRVARIHQSRVFLFKWSKMQMACCRWRQSGCTALILGPKEWIWQQGFVYSYWRLIPSQVVKIITPWKGKPCNQTEKKAQLMKSSLKSLSSWSIKFGGTENWILLLIQQCREVRPQTMQTQCTIYFLEVTYLKCTVKHKVDNIVAV